ncbi:MAG: hypothetical protein ACRD3D_18240 [Terriglobia bacterium]
MKNLCIALAIILFAAAALPAQDGSGSQQQQQQQRPTLGAEPAPPRPTLNPGPPSLGGPTTASVLNPAMLRHVKTVFIELMDDKLNLKLADDLTKDGPFRVVSSRKGADAVLAGTCFDSPHLREVHSEVFLTGRDGKSIWQDVIHQPYRPPSLAQAVNDTANLVVMHLRQSVAATEHK